MTIARPRTSRTRLTLMVAVAITAIVTASSADRGPTSSVAAGSDESTPRAGTPIRIRVGKTTMTARLDDNSTARDLVGQLPLTLTGRDFNRLEKIASLPRKLSTKGAPAGADPDVGDIGYYAPSGELVFYYGDVGYFSGVVSIGRFDSDLDVLRRQPDGFTVLVERAD